MSQNTPNIPSVSFESPRKPALITPETFSVALGTSSTEIFPGRADQYFLLRKVIFANTTAGSINITLTIDGVEIVSSEAVAADTTVSHDVINGLLLDPGDAFAGLGSGTGVRAFGWGVRVSGGDTWVL